MYNALKYVYQIESKDRLNKFRVRARNYDFFLKYKNILYICNQNYKL